MDKDRFRALHHFVNQDSPLRATEVKEMFFRHMVASEFEDEDHYGRNRAIAKNLIRMYSDVKLESEVISYMEARTTFREYFNLGFLDSRSNVSVEEIKDHYYTAPVALPLEDISVDLIEELGFIFGKRAANKSLTSYV